MYPDLLVTGEDAAHDLRLFIEDLSDSANIKAESLPEQVLTVEDVSKRFKVSTKTVDRWRNRGLVSRRFMFGNRKRIGFLKSSVERFVARTQAMCSAADSSRRCPKPSATRSSPGRAGS